MHSVRLDAADLSGAILFKVLANYGNFSGITAENAAFVQAGFSWATFVGADLDGADFTQANLYGTDLTNASLVGANFYMLGTGSTIGGTKFIGADLTNASFVKADLRPYSTSAGYNIYFTNATLYNADFTGAYYGTGLVSFDGANLECAKFDANVQSNNVSFEGAICPDGTLGDAVNECDGHLTRDPGCP